MRVANVARVESFETNDLKVIREINIVVDEKRAKRQPIQRSAGVAY